MGSYVQKTSIARTVVLFSWFHQEKEKKDIHKQITICKQWVWLDDYGDGLENYFLSHAVCCSQNVSPFQCL